MFENVFGATKSIDWTSIIDTLIVVLLPIVLELLTGIGRYLGSYIKEKVNNKYVNAFINDIGTVYVSFQQKFVIEWKKMKEDGKLSPEERTKLKEMFMNEVTVALKRYPKELADYLKGMAEHWLEEKVASEANKLMDPTNSGSGKETSEPETLSPEELVLANSEATK